MSVDESISRVNSSFGLPITGHGPKSLLKRLTAKFIWPFLRHQVDVNHVLVAELREIQARQTHLVATVEAQRVGAEHTAAVLRQLSHQLDFVEDGVGKVNDARLNIEAALHILEGQFTSVVQQRESHLADVQSHLTKRTQQLENQIDLGHRQLLARFYDGFGALQRDVTELSRYFGELKLEYDQFEETKIAGLLARMAEVDHFLTEVKRSYPELVKPERLVKLATGFDAIERAHAMRFRGTRDSIIERIAVYVPELKSVAGLGPVLDIGCGGGELLEVLRDNDVDAYGIEIVEAAVQECRSLGLDARLDDVLHHLSSVPPASLGAVTAIHVVEHLGIDTLIEVIDLSLKALKPGGVIIFETPNPGNVLVGADSFYIDPTHDHPIPSALLEFLVSIRGFADAQVMPLKRAPNLFTAVMPDEGVWANDVSRVAQHVANVFLGAEDYAVIARRAL
ncbi:MAG: class I SAM-dependent methyltransferase [Acidobacteria bacterium]|nr:class I SAM-dependent methyltransferase [Acidobacteriota bacterium]